MLSKLIVTGEQRFISLALPQIHQSGLWGTVVGVIHRYENPAIIENILNQAYSALEKIGLSEEEIANMQGSGLLDKIVQDFTYDSVLAFDFTAKAVNHWVAAGQTKETILDTLQDVFSNLKQNYKHYYISQVFMYLGDLLKNGTPLQELINADRQGVFDSINKNYTIDYGHDDISNIFNKKILKFSWVKEFILNGIQPNRLYNNRLNGILDKVSEKYSNGKAVYVANTLIDISRIGKKLGIPGNVLTNAQQDGIFDQLPNYFNYNDLKILEKELEKLHLLFKYYEANGIDIAVLDSRSLIDYILRQWRSVLAA